ITSTRSRTAATCGGTEARPKSARSLSPRLKSARSSPRLKMAIDPTARIAAGARIDASVEIGPYCIIGPQVELQRGVRLLAHVYLTGLTTIGEGTVVYPFSSLGTPPQSVHYRRGATRLVIRARCEARRGRAIRIWLAD